MGFLDIFRRSGNKADARRGVREAPRVQRVAEHTQRLDANPVAPAPQPVVPQAPSPSPAQAATVVVRPPSPDVAPSPSPSPRPSGDLDGKTERVDVSSLAPAQVVAVLVGVEGELEGDIFALRHDDSTVGRSASCEVRLDSKKISREHAKIMHRGGRFMISPLSDNPTVVDDAQVPESGTELKDDALVRLARTTLRFRTISGP